MFLGLLSLLSLAAATPVTFYKSCESVGEIISLDVTPCDGSSICEFPIRRNVTIKVTFRSKAEITAAKPVIYAHLGLLVVPEVFQLEQDSCNHFDSPCPLAANTPHVYTTVLHMEAYPLIRLVVEWQIHDQNDQTVVCFAVPIQVVSA